MRVLDEKGNVLPIVAVGIPRICDPLVRPVVPAHVLNAFNHLRLADDFDHGSPLDLDILIGLDYYWSLISPQDVVQVTQVVATKSVFGWILSGNLGNCSDPTGTSSSSACKFS